jgi:hypothetical protein
MAVNIRNLAHEFLPTYGAAMVRSNHSVEGFVGRGDPGLHSVLEVGDP